MSRKDVMAALVNMMEVSDNGNECMKRELYIEYSVSANMIQPISWQQLRDHVSRDNTMKMLCDQISGGFPPEKKLLREELREFWQHRENLSQVDGVPLFKSRVIVPRSLRAEVLETLHSAHQGVTGMNKRVQGSVWWPGITPQIQENGTNVKIVMSTCPLSQVHRLCLYPSRTTRSSRLYLTTFRSRATIT